MQGVSRVCLYSLILHRGQVEHLLFPARIEFDLVNTKHWPETTRDSNEHKHITVITYVMTNFLRLIKRDSFLERI